MQVALKAYGEQGILAYGLSDDERATLSSLLNQSLPAGCIEYVEGYDSLLFIFREPYSIRELAEWMQHIELGELGAREGCVHEIPVVYDGPDLESVAEQTGLTIEQIIEIHSGPVYTIRMMGFTPGFPYLDGLDPRLQLLRRDSPRNRIESGSVAIGGPHAGIYSVASPGGWHLLGRTEVKLFNPEAAKVDALNSEKVFLLVPGDQLRFQPVD